jgi:hypothetical protein
MYSLTVKTKIEIDLLDKNYVKWSKIKIKRLNSELSKDKNIMKFLNK